MRCTAAVEQQTRRQAARVGERRGRREDAASVPLTKLLRRSAHWTRRAPEGSEADPVFAPQRARLAAHKLRDRSQAVLQAQTVQPRASAVR